MGNFQKRAIKMVVPCLTLLAPILGFAANATPDFYKCSNRVSGEWNYGRAPYACDANAFGDDRFVNQNYASLLFLDHKTRETERKRYGDEINAMVKEAARVYLLKRKASASTSEIQQWTLLVQATSAHESYWSHYRYASDGRIKMMRGDYGHGHGLMQVDDRHHFPAVTEGIAWNVVTNLAYGMDILFEGWQRAPSQSCVGSATNWEPRIRSAWSAYNGGPGQICRWTKTTGTWAHNDKNFYDMLKARAWEKVVVQPNLKTSIAVACLIEKRENCSLSTPDVDPIRPQEARLYRIAGQICLVKNSIFFCLEDERDRQCLSAVGLIASEDVIEWSESQAKTFTRQNEDRHLLCASYERSLIDVGSAIQVHKNIYLRSTPAGGQLSVVPSGSILQVRDFELRGSTRDRYYRVVYNGHEGYLFAGSMNDYNMWASEVSSAKAQGSSMARLGEKVKITSTAGINMRATPGGSLVATLARHSIYTVDEIVARGADNKIYYRVKSGTKTGYIYAGLILPSETLKDWAVPTR